MTIFQQAGTVAFAAITDPVRCTASDPPFYVVFLTDERWFVSSTQPRLYDQRKLIPARSIPPGSVVTLGLDERNRIAAIQIVSLADDCPFPEIA
jgi:hypothetical protein